jgi:hypothetical protein
VLAPRTNLDLLAWFSDEERGICPDCGAHAVVSLSRSAAEFCLACGGMWFEGERRDDEGRIAS